MRKAVLVSLVVVFAFMWGYRVGVPKNAPSTSVALIPTPRATPDFFSPSEPPPPDAPPSLIIVGPYVYTLKWRSAANLPDDYGITSLGLHVILVQKGMEPGLTRETVMHELTHCAMDIGNGARKSSMTEDEFIESAVPALVMILRDNPRLREWLGRDTLSERRNSEHND